MKNTIKTKLIALITLALSLLSATAHERITVGPGDGRLAYLDSTTMPYAEFNVKDGKVHITLLDKDLKTINLTDQTLAITVRQNDSPIKLIVSKSGTEFIAPLPDGTDIWCIFQLKEKEETKAITFRIHYLSEVCAECKKPEWRCICGNKGSGKEVEIPADLKGLWAEINGHHGELVEALESRDFAAIHEVTDAYPLLIAALPGKSGDQQAAATPLVEAIMKNLAAIQTAGAARMPDAAATNAATVAQAVGDLKKLYPPDVANAKLAE